MTDDDEEWTAQSHELIYQLISSGYRSQTSIENGALLLPPPE